MSAFYFTLNSFALRKDSHSIHKPNSKSRKFTWHFNTAYGFGVNKSAYVLDEKGRQCENCTVSARKESRKC